MGATLPERSWASLLGQIAKERRLRDPQRPADVLHGVRRVAVERHGVPLLLVIEITGLATLPPACSGNVEAGEGPLPDEDPLELGQRPEDVEDELPAAGRRIDGLL
jgi:hypothetical protein